MRKQTLAELALDLTREVELLSRHIHELEWHQGHLTAKICAQLSGQLLHRLTAINDVWDEASSAGAVDRAIRHA